MWTSEATCGGLQVKCWSSAHITIISSHVTCSRHDITEKYSFGVKQQSLTHSKRNSFMMWIWTKHELSTVKRSIRNLFSQSMSSFQRP
jgi:hypothetical protein